MIQRTEATSECIPMTEVKIIEQNFGSHSPDTDADVVKILQQSTDGSTVKYQLLQPFSMEPPVKYFATEYQRSRFRWLA